MKKPQAQSLAPPLRATADDIVKLEADKKAAARHRRHDVLRQ